MKKANEEIEVVFLEIDKADIEKKLKELGAEKVGDYHFKFAAFDHHDMRLNKDNAWIRLRHEGDKTVLAYKKRLGVTSQDGSTNDEGMEEVEVNVHDYDTTLLFMEKIGMLEKHRGEKKRTRWKLGEIIFDIDDWPAIPTLLEIEASSWEDVDKAIGLLELNPEDKKICSGNQIYMMYGINIDEHQKLMFNGLEKKANKESQ